MYALSGCLLLLCSSFSLVTSISFVPSSFPWCQLSFFYLSILFLFCLSVVLLFCFFVFLFSVLLLFCRLIFRLSVPLPIYLMFSIFLSFGLFVFCPSILWPSSFYCSAFLFSCFSTSWLSVPLPIYTWFLQSFRPFAFLSVCLLVLYSSFSLYFLLSLSSPLLFLSFIFLPLCLFLSALTLSHSNFLFSYFSCSLPSSLSKKMTNRFRLIVFFLSHYVSVFLFFFYLSVFRSFYPFILLSFYPVALLTFCRFALLSFVFLLLDFPLFASAYLSYVLLHCLFIYYF